MQETEILVDTGSECRVESNLRFKSGLYKLDVNLEYFNCQLYPSIWV